MSTNIVAGSTSTNYEAATSHTITVRETLAGASNSPRDTVLTINVTDVAEGGAWTPASLDGTVRYFSVKLSVTQSGGVVSAVPDLNGGSDWLPNGTGTDVVYSATSFSGSTPGITTTGARGLRNASISTGGSSVWCFFANCYIDDTTPALARVFSAAPSTGFQDFGNDGAQIGPQGTNAGTNAMLIGFQDGVGSAGGACSRDAYHRVGYVCNGSTETVYVDGVVAATVSGSANPATPPSAPHALAAIVHAGVFVRADSGAVNGAIGKFQSGIFKVGGTAPNSTALANIDTWLQNPV